MSKEDRATELIFGIPFVLACILFGTPVVIKAAGMSHYWVWLCYVVVGLLVAAMLIDWIMRIKRMCDE